MTAFIFDLIGIIPLSLVAVLFGRSYIANGTQTGPICIAAVLLTTLCILFCHMKARGRILLSGIAAALAFGLFFAGRSEMTERFFWILPVLIICIVSFLIGKAADRSIAIKASLAAVLFVSLITMMVTKSRDIKGIVVASIFYIILFIVEAVQMKWKKEGDPGVRAHVVYMLPFVLAVIIPLSLIKAPDRPYDWKFFKDMAKNVRVGFEMLMQELSGEGGWDGGDTMGFSERGAIGGSVSGEPYTVLSVSADTENDYRLYLSGKTFDTFDGRKWEKSDTSDIDEKTYDLVETIAAIRKYDSEHTDGLLKNVMLHIRYEGIRTKQLFTPAKAIPEISQMSFSQKGGDMVTGSRKKSDYIIRYYRLNRDDPAFEELLESGIEVSDSDRQQAILEYLPAKQDMYSEEGYSQYRQLVEDVYLPAVNITDRTRSYMDEYLAGADSDAEKLERIEKLLSSFRYTRTPGDIPENITSEGDFLDWFLFEKKEGFCTHFATSFVLLARAYNIPARYVQGFSTLSKRLRFDIGSDRTHAWPEAYIDGIGWLGFEPTPGYRQTAGWDTSENGVTQSSGESVHSTYEGNRSNVEADGSKDIEKESGIGSVLNVLGSRFVKIIATLTALFVVMFFAADRVFAKYRYSHMSDEEKLFELCRRNMKLLKRIGYGIGQGETLAEFRGRVQKGVPEGLVSFTGTYEDILYREREDFRVSVPAMERDNLMLRKYVFGEFLRRFGLRRKISKKNEI